MAFRAKRQKRYDYLRAHGFLANEAQLLSKIPRGVPYLNIAVSVRSKLSKKAKSESWTDGKYRKFIQGLYDKHHWTDGEGKRSVWAFLRFFESRYLDSHPDYVSPWVKKQKDWRDFEKKYEETRKQMETREASQKTREFMAHQEAMRQEAWRQIEQGRRNAQP